MSKVSSCNLTSEPKEVKSMSGVFRQNSDKSSVYSDAATVTPSHRPLPSIISESVSHSAYTHKHMHTVCLLPFQSSCLYRAGTVKPAYNGTTVDKLLQAGSVSYRYLKLN